MTLAEQKLWSRLRCKQLHGYQFYRQKIIGRYIVDFYCHAAKLVIEVDGGQHFEAAQQQKDKERTQFLEQMGLSVLRFTSRDVIKRLDSVVETIEISLKNPPESPFEKGG